MNQKQAEKKYGKEMLKKMEATGYLDGITISLTKDGEVDVPESDYERAYRKAIGQKMNQLDWD